jgi:hypothetical protein
LGIYLTLNQQFILILIGRATAMGLDLKIPMLIRLLAENLFSLHTDTDSVNMVPFIGLALIDDEDEHTYSFNWWDKHRVNGIVFCVLGKHREFTIIFSEAKAVTYFGISQF